MQKVKTFLWWMCLVLCFLGKSVEAETDKIVKVLDSNLFELKDGTQIRLAFVSTPSIRDSNRLVASFALRIKLYAEEQFLNRHVTIEYLPDSDSASTPRPVHIIKTFPLKTVWYNKAYLERGYGKFVNEMDTTRREECLQAEAFARKRKRGIWKERFGIPLPHVRLQSIMVGMGRARYLDSNYREILFSSEPLSRYKDWGLRFFASFGKQAIELGGFQKGLHYLVLNPYVNGSYRFLGFTAGAMLFYEKDWADPIFLVLPTAQIRFGDLQRYYLSIDLLTDWYSPATIGVNLLKAAPYRKIWLGISPVFIESTRFAIKVDYQISARFIMKAEGLYSREYRDQYSKSKKYSFGLRIGFGMLVTEMK